MRLTQVNQYLWEMPQPPGIFAAELLERGRSYFEAFRKLSADDDQRLRHPTYFLLAHSMEIVLKSFLVARGVAKADLGRGKLGHDLTLVLNECETKGLPHVHALLRPLANQLAEINKDFDLRYPTRFRLIAPAAQHCHPIMEALIVGVAEVVLPYAADAQLQYAEETRHLKGFKVRWSD